MSLVLDHAPRSPLRRLAYRWTPVYEKRLGYLYVRSRAISSRTNENYDSFPADELRAAYRTFLGKPVFVNHRNDDPRRARGVIIDAALHEDFLPNGDEDVWVELLHEVHAARYPMLADAIREGKVNRTSMGVNVDYSVCSVCGNKAYSPTEFCRHIPALKGQRIRRINAATGKLESVLCHERCYGLSFFENSLLVEPPADPTAVVLGWD